MTEPSAAKKWERRLLGFAAIAWSAATLCLVMGALLPRASVLGVIGTLFESFFSLHLVLAAGLGLILALIARQVGGGRPAKVAAVMAVIAMVGAIIPLAAILRLAHQDGASISWTDHLHVSAREKAVPRDQTVRFATVDGKDLYADIYLPTGAGSETHAAVLVLHGGGYIRGERSMMPNWDRWLSERGYTVFDADYRLAPPPTWNQAAQDAACAMVWIASHADEYHVDANRMMVAGQSAGAGLALQVAYGLGDGTVQSSCGGSAPQAKAVFALYPPDDFALGWNMRTKMGPADGRRFLRAYIGGGPDEFPERYKAVSAIFHVRAGLPPTLIAAGEHDHLVPFQGHVELVDELKQAGVPAELVAIPYSDHAFDVLWGSLGGQITRHALEEFLRHYLPATQAPQ